MIPLREALRPTPRQLRGFGYVAVAGFALIGWLAVRTVGADLTAFWILLGVGGLMLGETLLDDFVLGPGFAPLRPWVYRLLLVVAFPLGFVVSWLLLALVYYLLFTPVALWFKLIGRDKMQRRPDPAAATYWRERPERRAPATYLRMH
jgi:hypothetical protein